MNFLTFCRRASRSTTRDSKSRIVRAGWISSSQNRLKATRFMKNSTKTVTPTVPRMVLLKNRGSVALL